MVLSLEPDELKAVTLEVQGASPAPGPGLSVLGKSNRRARALPSAQSL